MTSGNVIADCISRNFPKECSPPEWSGLWSEIVEGYLSITVTIVGLFGNIMSLVVLRQPGFQGFQEVFNKLLIALAYFDLIFLGK